MATGKRIRFFRTKIGLTQKQLGEKLGFTGREEGISVCRVAWNPSLKLLFTEERGKKR